MDCSNNVQQGLPHLDQMDWSIQDRSVVVKLLLRPTYDTNYHPTKCKQTMGIWLVTLSVLYRRSAVVKALLRFTYDAKYHPTRCKQITGIWLVTLWQSYRCIGFCLPLHLFFSYFYSWFSYRLTLHRFSFIATSVLVLTIIIVAQCSLGRILVIESCFIW